METTGKEIQRLNNKLDKVLEKLLAVEALEERKADAIAQIQAGDIAQAIETLKAVEKGLTKADSLQAEESALRDALKAQLLEAEQAAQGKAETQPDETGSTVSAIARKVA